MNKFKTIEDVGHVYVISNGIAYDSFRGSGGRIIRAWEFVDYNYEQLNIAAKTK